MLGKSRNKGGIMTNKEVLEEYNKALAIIKNIKSEFCGKGAHWLYFDADCIEGNLNRTIEHLEWLVRENKNEY